MSGSKGAEPGMAFMKQNDPWYVVWPNVVSWTLIAGVLLAAGLGVLGIVAKGLWLCFKQGWDLL